MLLPLPGLDHAPEGAIICRVAPEGLAWIDASTAAREFLGEPLGGPGRATLLDVVHPDDRALAAEEFRRAAELGERHDFVLRLCSAQGDWHFVRGDAQARYDRDGTLNHVRCHFIDVTDRIRAEQELRRRTELLTEANDQLRQANFQLKQTQAQLVHTEKLAALGTLAAGMAHELNNPLAFASNNAAVLERDVATVLVLIAAYREGRSAIATNIPELDERLDQLERQGDLAYLQEHLVDTARATRRGVLRAAKIVADLRSFARLDLAHLAEINPNDSLDQAITLLGEHLTRLQIEVIRDYGTLPSLECVVGSINQVLFHLLMNAVQAIEDAARRSGRITVSTRAQADEMVIEITDDGCGIPAEVLPRIFDPFFTTKPVGRGTGLGLSISHGIVTEHQGRIEVENNVGQGARCRLRLPIRRLATSIEPTQ